MYLAYKDRKVENWSVFLTIKLITFKQTEGKLPIRWTDTVVTAVSALMTCITGAATPVPQNKWNSLAMPWTMLSGGTGKIRV